MSAARTRLEIDLRAAAPQGAAIAVAEVLHPPAERLHAPPIALCCVPGGGMSRRYFDLRVPAGLGNYSMAEHLAARGFAVVLLDPIGVGESSRPDDGFALTPELLADLNAAAFGEVLAALREGSSGAALPPLPALVSLGLGHSAGGLLTVYQQAQQRSHAGLVLLGTAGRGMPSQLSEEEKRYADAPEALRRDLARLARRRFGSALPTAERGSSELLVRVPLPPPVHAALLEARTELLALVGLASIVPGSAKPVCDAIDVPIFLGVGAFDITGDPHEIPAQFRACPDLTLFVLPQAGHNHNAAATREALWDRVAAWAESLFARPGGAPTG